MENKHYLLTLLLLFLTLSCTLGVALWNLFQKSNTRVVFVVGGGFKWFSLDVAFVLPFSA